jgi:hypothetical protein
MSWSNFFSLFLIQCYTNLRDLYYIFIAGQFSQVYVEMLV